MKTTYSLIVLLSVQLMSYAQEASDIIKASRKACSQVHSGYYEMDQFIKFMTRKDTLHRMDNKTYFMKNEGDTLLSWLYLDKGYKKDTLNYTMLYDGETQINAFRYDSTAQVIRAIEWPDVIKRRRFDDSFYGPLMHSSNYPLPADSDLVAIDRVFKLHPEEKINGTLCYHIQDNELTKREPADTSEYYLRIESHYWINKTDLIPIQYVQHFDMVLDNDTMYQYELRRIKNYKFNHLKDKSIFSQDSIPSYFKRKDYEPYKLPELLPVETMAPTWKLIALNDDSLSLAHLKGKVVLIDFFYKSCHPCMKALPLLQKLHEKYKDQGLVVIGIDPIDNKIEDDMTNFLAKRGVTYPVLFSTRELSKQYSVSAYPTIYILDKEGKIIHRHSGYSEEMDDMLSQLIEKHL